jgi:perosamine synthetase
LSDKSKRQDDGYRVPMSSPDLTHVERQVVAEVLETPRLSMGPYEKAFEDAVREFAGVKHAIAVSSGTAGLHLCVRAAGISDGDWVITTPFSFVASANVMLYERAVPIFVDVDDVTGNIDPNLVEEAAKDLRNGGNSARRWLPREGIHGHAELKAILPVDVFGQPPDFEPLLKTAKTYGLYVIEDSCEALGSTYKSKQAGTFGDAGIYAFYPNKQITTGEGGVIITDHASWESMMRSMRNQGRAPGDTWLNHTYLGYNYRLNELSAALGAVQMTRLDELINKREQVARWYMERLGELQGVEGPRVVPNTTRMSWFVFVVRFDPGVDRDNVVNLLKEKGIPARPYFIPIHLQEYMRKRFGYREGDFPVTEDLGRRGLALPFSSVMTQEQVEEVCQALQEVMEMV